MRQTIGIVLSLLVILACIVSTVLLFVGLFNETSQTLDIGPHDSIAWKENKSLTAEGPIILRSSSGITVTKEDGSFVTATIPGEIPAGEKLPVFTSQFYAEPSVIYHSSDSVSIYSDNQLKVTLSWYPISENLSKILLVFIATSIIMWLIEKIFDLGY